jgi:hypothetical protein
VSEQIKQKEDSAAHVELEEVVFQQMRASVPTATSMLTGKCGDPNCPGLHGVLLINMGPAAMPICDFLITEESVAIMEKALAMHRGKAGN